MTNTDNFNRGSMISGIVEATQEQEAIATSNANFLQQANEMFRSGSALGIISKPRV